MVTARTGRALLLVTALAAPRVAASQEVDVTTEADITLGRSTEDGVRAAGTQLRAFGTLPREWRFYAEASCQGCGRTTAFHRELDELPNLFFGKSPACNWRPV